MAWILTLSILTIGLVVAPFDSVKIKFIQVSKKKENFPYQYEDRKKDDKQGGRLIESCLFDDQIFIANLVVIFFVQQLHQGECNRTSQAAISHQNLLFKVDDSNSPEERVGKISQTEDG